jgi:ATP/maltotriose-dependent transcriptional regulator MalT
MSAMTHRPCRYVTSLTPREMEVLELLCAGNSNREIGSSIEVTQDTVKYHLKSIYVKLGVRHRLEAALMARSIGLTRPPSGLSDMGIVYVS